MNERELIAETIATVKRDGWIKGWLAAPGEQSGHCILGAVGRARWGKQWDIDCHDRAEEDRPYARLDHDPVTRSVVNRIYDVVLTRGAYQEEEDDEDGATAQQVTVYFWNDNRASEEEILEVLEKVQAEIG